MNFESGKIQTIAGTGEPGYSGDGGPAGRALLREPFMCDFDRQGNLYFPEARNHTVRRVDLATGVITTVAGGFVGDGAQADPAERGSAHRLVVQDVRLRAHDHLVAATAVREQRDQVRHRPARHEDGCLLADLCCGGLLQRPPGLIANDHLSG